MSLLLNQVKMVPFLKKDCRMYEMCNYENIPSSCLIHTVSKAEVEASSTHA